LAAAIFAEMVVERGSILCLCFVIKITQIKG
jgi:hypothetical protein